MSFLVVGFSDVRRRLPFSFPNSSHHSPGAVSYNVTLHQHEAPPGVESGEAGNNRVAEARGKSPEWLNGRLDPRSYLYHKEQEKGSPPSLVRKVPQIRPANNKQKNEWLGAANESEFTSREFDRLDTLLNLSLIHRKRALEVSKYLINIGRTTIETGLRMVLLHGKSKTQTKAMRNRAKIGHRLISVGEKILARGENILKTVAKGTTGRKLQSPSPKVSNFEVVTPVIKMIPLCSHGPSFYGVTLLGGIRAGHFVGHGRVDNMQACIKKCCANEQCDLAFMVKDDCFSVICYHKTLCQSVRARHVNKYRPRIAHIWRGSTGDKESRSHFNTRPTPTALRNHKNVPREDKKTIKKQIIGDNRRTNSSGSFKKHFTTGERLPPAPRSSHNPSTRQEEVKEQASVKQSFSHGKYQGSSFNASLHVIDETLRSEHSVHEEPSKTDSPTTITFGNQSAAVAHGAEQKSEFPVVSLEAQEKRNSCPHTEVKYNLGFRYGLKTGTFSYIGEVMNMIQCVEYCCLDLRCDISFLLDLSCYIVRCSNELTCHSVPYHQDKYFTKTVFVTRRFNKLLAKENTPHLWEPKYRTKEGVNTDHDKQSRVRMIAADERNSWRHENAENQNATRLITSPMKENPNKSRPWTHPQVSDKGVSVISEKIPNRDALVPETSKHKVKHHAESPRSKQQHPTCPHSEVIYNIGLRYGLKTGTFLYIGEVTSVRDCLKNCCLQLQCDIAFMLDRFCYTVKCWNDLTCRGASRPQSRYSTVAVFVTRRFNKADREYAHGKHRVKHSRATVNSTATSQLMGMSKIAASPGSDGKETYVRINPAVHQPAVLDHSEHGSSGQQPVKKRQQQNRNTKIGRNQWDQENRLVDRIANGKINQGNVWMNFAEGYKQGKPSDLVKSSNSLVAGSQTLPDSTSVSSALRDSLFRAEKKGTFVAQDRSQPNAAYETLDAQAVSGSAAFQKKLNVNRDSQLFGGESDLYNPAAKRDQSPRAQHHAGSAAYGEANDDIGSMHFESVGSSGGSSINSGFSGSGSLSPPAFIEGSGKDLESGSAALDTRDNVPRNAKTCTPVGPFYNVTLRGGFSAGNFTFLGKVSSFNECLERCCSSGVCDVTFLVLDRCFIVDCFNDYSCDLVVARNALKYKPVILYVNLTLASALGSKLPENVQSTEASKVGQGRNVSNLQRARNSTEPARTAENKTEPFRASVAVNPSKLGKFECSFGIALHNVSFRLGRQAGIFSDLGPILNTTDCARKCCEMLECNVAFIISENCFSVNCHSNESCRTLPIPGSKFNPSLIPVRKRLFQVTTVVRPDFSLNHASYDSKSNSRHWPNQTLLVYNNPSESYWHIMKNSKASVVSSPQSRKKTLRNMVVSLGESSVTRDTSRQDINGGSRNKADQIPSGTAGFLEVMTDGSRYWWQAFKPKEGHTTSPGFKVAVPDVSGKSVSPASAAFHHVSKADRSSRRRAQEQAICHNALIVEGVTLKGGYYSGIFTIQKNVTSMEGCVSRCCQLHACNLAFMVTKVCYAVRCFSEEKCKSVKAHYAAKYQPQVSFVRNLGVNIAHDDTKPPPTSYAQRAFGENIRDNLRCTLDDISEPKYRVGAAGSFLTHKAVPDLGDCAKLCCQTKKCEVALHHNGTCLSLNCHGNLTCPNNSLPFAIESFSRSVHVVKDSIRTEKLVSRFRTEACDFSNVLHEVVLRGGSHSGKFKYLEDVEEMSTCIKECCEHKVCDVALMLKDNCFLVSCYDEMLCDAIPTRSSSYHPKIAYKRRHGARRHVGKELLLLLLLLCHHYYQL